MGAESDSDEGLDSLLSKLPEFLLSFSCRTSGLREACGQTRRNSSGPPGGGGGVSRGSFGHLNLSHRHPRSWLPGAGVGDGSVQTVTLVALVISREQENTLPLCWRIIFRLLSQSARSLTNGQRLRSIPNLFFLFYRAMLFGSFLLVSDSTNFALVNARAKVI
ncbi:hypothetical protein LX36DRAFT_148757 [Colletotrichum falcatum]|nr:hypothetical protein LX36DRAFT_148757 [Colletotrichum falcatum]